MAFGEEERLVSKADDLRKQGHVTCPACDQKLYKLNPHRMDKAKIVVLEALAKIGGWVFCAQDEKIVKADFVYPTLKDSRVHAQRLHYFGLVNYMGPRTGTYCANSAGVDFLRGIVSVPEKIWVRRSPDGRGAVVEEVSTERVFVHQAKGVVLDRAYWDAYGSFQK
jgi:hypothetical protein